MRFSAQSDQKYVLVIRRTILFANDHLQRNRGAQRRPDYPDGHLQQSMLLHPFDFGHLKDREISQKYYQAFPVAYKWSIHPSKFWSQLALISVSVPPKSFSLSCFLDIFPGKVVQPGPPIIYPWDVSRSCARRLCPQTNYSNTSKHATIQNIS